MTRPLILYEIKRSFSVQKGEQYGTRIRGTLLFENGNITFCVRTPVLTGGGIGGKEMCAIPVIDMTKTGQNIVILRKRAGLSVRNLQDAFGFGTPQAIYKWQQGLALPTIDNLVALAALLNVTIDDIIVTDKQNQIQESA